MVEAKKSLNNHPTEIELADLLANSIKDDDRERIESHIAGCGECLTKIVSGYESVKMFKADKEAKKGRRMKNINFYLVFAILSFILSFIIPRYFLQLLLATALLGIKWIVDSKTARMLVMIYEAWKNGGDREASRVLETLDAKNKQRF